MYDCLSIVIFYFSDILSSLMEDESTQGLLQSSSTPLANHEPPAQDKTEWVVVNGNCVACSINIVTLNVVLFHLNKYW